MDMEEILKITLYSFFAGITVFFGGLLSKYFEKYFKEGFLKEEIIHTSIAFGGGIIFAAVAFVLVPKGMETLTLWRIVILFCSGAILFFFLDRYIEQKGGTISQLLAMLMDFVPEAIALGALFATDPNLGLLLAIFIGLQNFPEAFNSYRDLKDSGFTSNKCLWILFLLSFSGVISAISGYFLLSDLPQLTASLMLFSSGGILYLVFQDIAPMSKMEKTWLPAMGATFGFLVGMMGQKILG
jgi:ZIP family zinc transporter